MIIYNIRHCEPYTVGIKGKMDTPETALSPLGRLQAWMVGHALRDILRENTSSDGSHIYASETIRGMQSTIIMCRIATDIPITYLIELKERGFGPIEGLTKDQLAPHLPQRDHPNVDHFLFYGTKEQFIDIGKKVRAANHMPYEESMEQTAEDWKEFVDTGWMVSEFLWHQYGSIENSRIAVINHQMRGTMLLECLTNMPVRQEFPNLFQGEDKYERWHYRQYGFPIASLHKLELTEKLGRMHCTNLGPIGDHSHLVLMGYEASPNTVPCPDRDRDRAILATIDRFLQEGEDGLQPRTIERETLRS